MSKAGLVLPGSLESQSRLAGAAWTYQADAPGLWVGDEPVQIRQLLLSSKEGG
jgi:hypothetical protein